MALLHPLDVPLVEPTFGPTDSCYKETIRKTLAKANALTTSDFDFRGEFIIYHIEGDMHLLYLSNILSISVKDYKLLYSFEKFVNEVNIKVMKKSLFKDYEDFIKCHTIATPPYLTINDELTINFIDNKSRDFILTKINEYFLYGSAGSPSRRFVPAGSNVSIPCF